MRRPQLLTPARTIGDFMLRQAFARVGGLITPINAAWLFDDFLQSFNGITQPPGWRASLVGTAAGVLNLADEGGGVHQLSTGANSGSINFMTTEAPAVRDVSTAPWYCAFRQKITTAVAAQSNADCGLVNQAVTKTLCGGYIGSLNAANFIFQYDGAEFGASSLINTGIAVDTAYHTFEMWGRGDGKFHCAIDFGADLAGGGAGVTMVAAPTDSCNGLRVARNGTDAVVRTKRDDWFALLCKRT